MTGARLCLANAGPAAAWSRVLRLVLAQTAALLDRDCVRPVAALWSRPARRKFNPPPHTHVLRLALRAQPRSRTATVSAGPVAARWQRAWGGTNPAPVPIRTCCGWRFAHSRSPGPRLCPPDQSQRVDSARRAANPALVAIPTCCGWCFAHSRAPGPRLCPQDQSQHVGLARRVGNSIALPIPRCCGWCFAHSRAPGPRLCPQDQSQRVGSARRAAKSSACRHSHVLRLVLRTQPRSRTATVSAGPVAARWQRTARR